MCFRAFEIPIFFMRSLSRVGSFLIFFFPTSHIHEIQVKGNYLFAV